MDTVGIRDLKTHLSRHLKRVRAGARLVITEHGRSIATISPADVPDDLDWAHRLIAEGNAHWSGGKPGAPATAKKPAAGTAAVDAVIEDRR